MDEMPDVKMNTIGERMRFLRERVNLKQSAFAERVLVSGSYISKVETGEEIPSDIFTKLVAYGRAKVSKGWNPEQGQRRYLYRDIH